MTDTDTVEAFPLTLYNVTGRFVRNREVARMIAADQQLFGAFFTMVYKLIAYNTQITKYSVDPAVVRLSRMIADVNSKSFSVEEISKSTLMVDSLRKQLGQHLAAEYLGKFLGFCDLFYKVQTHTSTEIKDSVPHAITGIGELMCSLAVDLRQGKLPASTVVEANVRTVGEIYELDLVEEVLLEHAALLSIDNDAAIFFKLYEQACGRRGIFRERLETALISLLHSGDVDGFGSMKSAMTSVDRVLSHKTSKVLSFNIVKLNEGGGVKQLSAFWARVLTYNYIDGAEGFINLFVKEVEQTKSYSSVIARMNEKMIPLLKEIIQGCSQDATMYRPQTAGVNMLLYGPKSLDKDQALHRALDGVAFNMYEANTDAEAWGDEASITWAAQRILEKKTHDSGSLNVLLVREASSVLSRGSRRMSFASIFGEEEGRTADKVELDSDVLIMTKSKTPTLWYTTDVTRLSPEAVGKFMLHLEVIPGTRADRKAEVEKIADGLNLPPEVRQALSKYMQLGAVQVETAANVVKLLKLEAPKSYETLLQLVEESQKALERDKIEELRTSVTKYDLGLLNIHGKFSPEQVITALQKKPTATLCFYGLPGTGKTQLAEYIADKLDKPLLVKRASDILSKWVGENEGNIAEMFREAKAEGAVLLLDEADSFLRDRSLARAQWEVTMVNELLQGMERHTGIFICASNLFDSLDAAALRRFTFKFQFLELDEKQRVKMFANESGVEPVSGTDLYDRLMMIQHLTPGDFATVKRQANLFDTQLTPDDWLIQLNEEAKSKLAGLRRNKFTDVDRV